MSGEKESDSVPSNSSTLQGAPTAIQQQQQQPEMMGEKPSTVSTVAFEGYLLQTLLDLQCRAEVEATVQDVVSGVEFAVDLQDQLTSHVHQEQAEQIIAAQEYALEETHIVQKERLKAQTLLADALVKDLWRLSKEVGGLLELKQKHEAMMMEYDELMAKLAQAEEDLYVARRNPHPPPPPAAAAAAAAAGGGVGSSTTSSNATPSVIAPPSQPSTTEAQSSKPAASTTTTGSVQPTSPPPPQQQQPSATIVKLPEKKSTAAVATTTTTITKPEATISSAEAATTTTTEGTPKPPPAALKTDSDEKGTPAGAADETRTTLPPPTTTDEKPTGNSTLQEPTSSSSPAAAPAAASPQQSTPPVVALLEDDDDDNADGDAPVATLESIDMEILMRIFGFLDPIDILNTAQVNISMYSRVDSLFGLAGDDQVGGSGVDDNVSTTSTLATTPTVAAATAGTVTTSATATTASASVSTTATPTATKSTPVPSQAATTANKTTAQANSNSNNNPIFGQRLLGGGGRNIFNMLQSGVAGATGTSGSSSTGAAAKQTGGGVSHNKGRDSGSSTNDGNKPPLSAAMANSMAAKLNDAEINAIISMTEKLRSKEKQVSLLIKDKEEAEGKLKGSEAVKDFLINKVRDMEKIMNKSDETEKKVTQQIASDQEVIAFLDGRVQELERTTRLIQKEKNAAVEELKAAKAQNDKKVAVLSDMLQFERQKVKENEREWKATKKLLVKEVKTCRVQIVALQAERDGFREQNDVLRKAVMSGGSSNKF